MGQMKDSIVVKIGGSTLGAHDTAIEDVASLHAAGRRVVVVHGGGNAATDWLTIHGVESEFVDGLRVTGADAIEVVTAVFAGLVNKQIVAGLNARGAPAFGLCGIDAGLIQTRQLDARLGFVGEITAIDTSVLDRLLANGFLPVIAPLGVWSERLTQPMNLNADTVAGEVAAALAAAELVFMTDVAHVRDGDGSSIEQLDVNEVEPLIERGVASGGMIPKLRAGVRAAAAGVRCHIIDGRESHALSRVLEGSGLGTRVVAPVPDRQV
jgi:acetylglutamate kinase